MIGPQNGDVDLVSLLTKGVTSLRVTPIRCNTPEEALDVLRTRPIDTLIWDTRALKVQHVLATLPSLTEQMHGAALIVISPTHTADKQLLEQAWHDEKNRIYAIVSDGLTLQSTWEQLLRNALQHASRVRQLQAVRTALRTREEAWDLIARSGHVGLWNWDLTSDRIEYSLRWKHLIGHSGDDVGQHPKEWFERVHPEDLDGLKNQIAMHKEGLCSYLLHEYRMRHKDGSYRWMLCRGMIQRDAAGEASRMAGTQTDISQHRIAEQRLLHDAFHDRLTGLPNRALFMERLERAAAYARRQPSYLYAILLLDIDRFKNINDSLGHHRGDQMLLALVERIRSCLRKIDTLARLSSDEFTVLLDGIRTSDEALRIAERLHVALASPFQLDEHEVFASSSIGIAVSDQATDEDPTVLLRQADTALHRAKTRGYARYELFDPSTHNHDVRLLTLENQLRRAIEHEDFVLMYQPIIDLSNNALAGVEALVRWKADDGSYISPTDFISLAEETGLIIPIGNWVMREAFRQMVSWQQEFPQARAMYLSVNISPKQFSQVGFVNVISRALSTAGLSPRHVHLEITENVLADNMDTTATMMQDLTAMGLRLSIDDFGTGYSSLRSLHRFPISSLKIDRTFIADLQNDNDKNAIVHTILTLAKNLSLDVVAEGIETPQQLAYLTQQNCAFGQGFLFAKPMLPADLERLLFRK